MRHGDRGKAHAGDAGTPGGAPALCYWSALGFRNVSSVLLQCRLRNAAVPGSRGRQRFKARVGGSLFSCQGERRAKASGTESNPYLKDKAAHSAHFVTAARLRTNHMEQHSQTGEFI